MDVSTRRRHDSGRHHVGRHDSSRHHVGRHDLGWHHVGRRRSWRPAGGRARWPLLGLAAVLLAVAGQLLTPPDAAAATAYRYWAYFHWDRHGWTFATTGAADSVPANGTVEGWRYAVAAADGPSRVPRAAGDFERLCAGTPAQPGRKRVGVVLDYGLAAEAPGDREPPAPRGGCAAVPVGASGADVLAAVADVRTDKGLVCGLDGYPARGCGDPVASPPAVPSPEPAVTLRLAGGAGSADRTAGSTPATASGRATAGDSPGQQPWAVVGVAAAVVLLAVGAGWRRRRSGRT